jgi:molybdopterin-containing oxidoreductase family membrane subunit
MAVSTEAPRAGHALSRFWVALLAFLVLAGAAAWIYQLFHGLSATGMRDVVSWGMYIFTFAFLVGLSAGGLIMASAAEVFGVESLKPLRRLGVLTAAACVVAAAVLIVPDLGRPDRIINLFIHPNWRSPLIWDLLIISVYFVFAVVDMWVMTRQRMDPVTRAKALRVLAFIGLPTAVLLHSITAWIFGLQIARTWWNTALLAPIFIASAIVSGTAFITLIALILHRYERIELPKATWRWLTGLLAVGIVVDLFFVACDYITIIWGNVPRERAALDVILPGGSWQWLFWTEWIIGGLIPFVLLVTPSLRRRFGAIGIASVLVMLGVFAYRIELVGAGLVRPLIQLAPGTSLGTQTAGSTAFQFQGIYHPTWVEYTITAGLLALLALLVTLGYRWLHVMRPEEVAPAGDAD